MSWKQDVLELVQTSPANVTLLLADADSGKELLSFNRDRRFVSASTIKTAILLCALEAVQKGNWIWMRRSLCRRRRSFPIVPCSSAGNRKCRCAICCAG